MSWFKTYWLSWFWMSLMTSKTNLRRCFEIINILILFIAKVVDSLLATSKTILVQRGKILLAGLSLSLSQFTYLTIMKNIIETNDVYSTISVSLAAGVGCMIAIGINDKLSKDKIYVNVIMSDNKQSICECRDFLASHKITNTVSKSYDLEWNETMTIMVYSQTKEQSRIIDNYINNSNHKYKRLINGRK